MDELYYCGFYVLDEFEKDWIVNLKDPPKDVFRAFFNTQKVSEDNYLILEIIILDEIFGDVKIGDIIKTVYGMLNYTIYRNGIEINNNGFESVYIIKNDQFKCFYDFSVNKIIEELYNKLKNYENVIGTNPYTEILNSIIEYYAK